MSSLERFGTSNAEAATLGEGQRLEKCQRTSRLKDDSQKSIFHQESLRPWDGVWRAKRPADFVDGLYRYHQYRALCLLQCGAPWTESAARILQAIAYQSRDLSELQDYWLERFDGEARKAVAS